MIISRQFRTIIPSSVLAATKAFDRRGGEKKMHHLQEVLDLSIVFTNPPAGSSPEVLARVAFRCEALGLDHTNDVFTNPLTPHEWDDLHWYLEEYWKWPYLEFAERGKQVEALLHDVGQRLYRSVLGGAKARAIVQKWQQQPGVLHQVSIVSDMPNILVLPWELLHDEQGFLALGTPA